MGVLCCAQVVADLIRISEEQRSTAVQQLKRSGFSRRASSDRLSRCAPAHPPYYLLHDHVIRCSTLVRC